jgi:nickel-dependent lactate racemase
VKNVPVSIPWGKDSIDLEVPDRWNIIGVLEPSAIDPVSDPEGEVTRSLGEPIGCGRLEQSAQGKVRVAIIIDDSSRPTPIAKILPVVLAELERGGVLRENLVIVPALGVHRGMDEAELAKRVGNELIPAMRWENPDCDDKGKMVFLGMTSRGTPVWVNKTVAEADLVISIGCIEPHIIASFGGGYKNLFPGVAGRETIAHNHALNCAPKTFNNVGLSIDANPMRQDLEEAGRMVKPPVFIVNAILNYRQELVQIVSGDPIKAHRAGVKISAKLYGADVTRRADVVITASHPMDIDLRQGVKALANTIRAVKPGGVLITFVKAEEGTGVFGLANRKLPLGKKALRMLSPLILPLVPKLKLKGMGEEDRFFLYFALQAMRHATLLMYGPTIPAETQANLPFVDFVDSPRKAMEVAEKRFPGKAEVLVFPHGGITYPNMT